AVLVIICVPMVANIQHLTASRAEAMVVPGFDWLSADNRLNRILDWLLYLHRALDALLWIGPLIILGIAYRRRLFPERLITTRPAKTWTLTQNWVRCLQIGVLAWLVTAIAVQNRDLLWSALGYGTVFVFVTLAVPKRSRYRWILNGALAL